MLTAKDFEERYKNYSHSQLLEILESPSHYQSIAVYAAKNELDSRNLLESQIDEARNQLESKMRIKHQKKEQEDLLISKVNNAGNSIYNTLNPINNSSPTTSKFIGLITLFYGLLFFYTLIMQSSLIELYLEEDPFDFVYFSLTVLPLLIVLFSTVLFGFKKRDGWKLLLFYCGFSITGVLYSIYTYVTLLFEDNSYYPLFPPSPFAIIIATLFYVGTILALSKPDMMKVYKVNKQEIIGFLIVGAIVGLVYHLIFL